MLLFICVNTLKMSARNDDFYLLIVFCKFLKIKAQNEEFFRSKVFSSLITLKMSAQLLEMSDAFHGGFVVDI